MMEIEFEIKCVVDMPLSGAWHCGPNPHWITITHLPTMISATAYGKDSQHKIRERAMDAIKYILGDIEKCDFPERMSEKDEWQSIETAPQTSKSIMVYCSERQNTYIVTWGQCGGFLGKYCWKIFSGNCDLLEIPTHWMPIPKPPTEENKG